MNTTPQQKLRCVFGLGKTGLAAARYLERIGENFIVIDTRETPPGLNDVQTLNHCVEYQLGNINVDDWAKQLEGLRQIILSPGVDPRIGLITTAVELGVEVVSDVEIFAQETKGRIVAITGSNGKSTVTQLTHQLLVAGKVKAEIGGNFGIPVLDFLPADEADVYVLELSSFQLDLTYSLSPEVATVLNISEDHMDRYDCFEDYVCSKQRIYQNAEKRLANLDDSLTKPKDKTFSSFSISEESADYRVDKVDGKYSLNLKGRTVLSVDEMTISGRHNWSNALAALGILSELEIEIDNNVINKLKSYRGLAHRFEKIQSELNIDWINDSKATNVGATLAAINSIDSDFYSPIILIAGGESKEADLQPLGVALTEKVDFVVLIGKDANKISALVRDKSQVVGSMKDAVNLSYQYAKDNLTPSKKAIVLLSPACASLDMYSNFEARGEEFRRCVEVVQ